MSVDWEDAFWARLGQSAHHLTQVALAHISDEHREELDKARSNDLRNRQRALSELREATRGQLDAALREQVLTDAEHSTELLALDSIDTNSPDIPAAQLATRAVGERIARAREQRAVDLRQQLKQMSVSDADRDRIEQMLVAQELAAVYESAVRTDGLCPIPEFGSKSKGHLRCLAVAGDLVEADIVARAKSLTSSGAGPLVVMTRESLDMPQRIEIAQAAIEEHVTFLIVDPLVLTFASQGGSGASSLERFFAATLPFTWANPFVTHGPVPPEMFYGREAEQRTLLDPNGSAFIFGGRQLGKSALLTKALDDFTERESGRVAIYLDLDSRRIGHGTATDRVWSHIGSELELAIPGIDAGRTEASVSEFLLGWLADDSAEEYAFYSTRRTTSSSGRRQKPAVRLACTTL